MSMTVDALALALGGGSKGEELARDVVRAAGGSLRQVRDLAGRYRTTAIGRRLVAVMEVAAAYAAERSDVRQPIGSPADAFRLMEPIIGAADQESLYVLCLDTQHHLIAAEEITRGTLNASLAHPREVFRVAIRRASASIIVCHNHPSGDPTPSADDRKLTVQLVAAGKVLDVPVVDHVIVGRGRYVSFAESGLIS